LPAFYSIIRICQSKEKNLTRILFLVLILLLYLPSSVFSNEIPVSISGNTRTKTSYIENIVKDYLQNNNIKEAADIDTDQLKDIILNKEIFSEVEVVTRDNQINIKVKDRWTLIPLPMIVAETDQDTKYGLFVMENNFLGYGKKMMLGAMLSASQSSYLLMYNDPELFFTNWQFKSFLMTRQKTTYLYKGEDKIYGDERDSSLASFSIGYAFTDKLEGSMSLGGAQHTFVALDDYDTPEEFSAIQGSIHVEWNNSNYRFYYREGFKAQASMEQQLARNDDDDMTQGLAVQINEEINLFAKQVCQLQVMAGYLHGGDERSYFRVGGNKGFRGVPDRGAWADQFLVTSLDYQIPLWFSKAGTWTVAPFVDMGYLHQPEFGEEDVTYTSYGLGTYLFLKQVAVPGLGFEFGHNDSYQKSFFKFTIGFSF
jgi:outer membrane protein assembly factor BamA